MGTELPYLVSVPDPYDDISPYHNWGPMPVTREGDREGAQGHRADRRRDDDAEPDGRVGALNLVTPLASVQVAATKLRGAIGLRSTWFTLGVMSLAPPAPNAPLPYGGQVTLSSTIRGVTGATLEQRTSGGTWQAVGPVAPGAVKLTQKPAMTTDYRLATPVAAAAYVRIRVAPLVQVTSFTTTLVTGTVQPLFPMAPVRDSAAERRSDDLGGRRHRRNRG